MVMCCVCALQVYPAEEIQYQGKVSLLLLIAADLIDK
jgi:hypothetical protein